MWGTGTEHCEQDPDFDVEVQILPNRILIIAKKVQIQQYPDFANMSRFNRIRISQICPRLQKTQENPDSTTESGFATLHGISKILTQSVG